MKRIAFAAAAALLGTGCISHSTTTVAPPPPNAGSVDFSWRFIRFIATNGSSVAYGCATAGVDIVVVAFPGGTVQVPCADAAGDGALIQGVAAGTQTVVVTGRRGAVELFSAQTTLTVAPGQTTAAALDVGGIPNNLAVNAHFLGRIGQDRGWTTCGAAGVATLSYVIADSANTVVATGTLSCTDPAGVDFFGNGALDRDNYVIRMRGFPPSSAVETFDSATTAFAPACNGQAFDHLRDDTWDVALYDVSLNSSFCN